MARKKQKKSHTGLWITILVTSLVLILAGGGTIAWLYWEESVDYTTFLSGSMPQSTSPSSSGTVEDNPLSDPTTPTLADNPIDFASLQELNSDVYAWLYVPGVEINLPVLQAGDDTPTDFYLHHNIYKNYEYKGCLYTEKANSKDFSDPVTVIYGHNMLNNTMFSNLDNFLDPDFFQANQYFYIYTPGYLRTYEIVSVHQYDKRHILNTNDFSNPEEFSEYLEMIQSPTTMNACVRGGFSLTTNDRIVTLSTCINHSTARLLLQGVLINEEPTN